MSAPLLDRPGSSAATGAEAPGLVITWAPWLRIIHVLGLIALGLLGVFYLGGLLLAAITALRDEENQLALLFGCLAATWLLLFTALWLLAFRSTRAALILSDDAITIRGTYRTRVIPWEQVARIEQHDGWYWRCAVRVVTHEGQSWISTVTSYQYVIMRGEPWHPHSSPDGTGPLEAPVRAAIAAHQRWLAAHRR